MGCGSCSTGGGCAPAGCKSNGACLTGGCQKMEVHDWLSNLDMPSNYRSFPIIEVKFKGSRKEFFVNSDDIYLEIGELIAVEGATGGYDIGHVSLTGELVRTQLKRRKTPIDQVTRKVYRKATEADVEKWKIAKGLEWETMHKARTLALDLKLSMKISDVDYQGDRTKATFFYTAEGRVDFRELIKKMAESFRIRIEMRQIGMRQEAGRLGGIGARPNHIGVVSDADGAIAAIATALKLAQMTERGDKLLGDVIVTTHICPNAPIRPHHPVNFMDSPLKDETMNEHEAIPDADAILSVDTTKGNRLINHKGYALSPTVKEGYILPVSEDLLQLMEWSSGQNAVTFPLSVQDITPYGNGLHHINSIMQPAISTTAPVVGVAICTQSIVPGCATGASHESDIAASVKFMVEVAKAFGGGHCQFYDKEQFKLLKSLYGDMSHLQA